MAKRRDKNRHSFWKRLHFRYRLSVLNENTLEEIWKLRVSMFHGIVLFLILFFVVLVLSSVIIITTPIRNYLPGYLDSEIREQAIKAAIQIDSLEQQQSYQLAQIENIKDIFEGKVQPDSEIPLDTVSISEDDKSLKSTSRELKFREQYEGEEKYNLGSLSMSDGAPTEGVTFFRPGKGVINKHFNAANKDFGLEMALSNEAVVATLEGTVIFAGYDPSMGYVIQIQHKNGFISTYKQTSMLLKKAGDKVRTGEAIAIVKADDSKDQSKKLLFELWYKSNPVNPELYITF